MTWFNVNNKQTKTIINSNNIHNNNNNTRSDHLFEMQQIENNDIVKQTYNKCYSNRKTLKFFLILIYVILSICCFTNVNSHESNYYYYYNTDGDGNYIHIHV